MVETVRRRRTRRMRPLRVRRAAGRRVHVVTQEEGKAIFDRQARHLLGISGEEFLRRWDAGEFRDATDMDEIHKINRLVMAMPFARRVPV